MLRRSGIGVVYIIIAGRYARPVLMSPHHRLIEHRRDNDDNDSTAESNAGLAVMNKATDGSKPVVINNDFH